MTGWRTIMIIELIKVRCVVDELHEKHCLVVNRFGQRKSDSNLTVTLKMGDCLIKSELLQFRGSTALAKLCFKQQKEWC